MCGIIVVFSKQSKVDIVQCDRALNRLRLRGPDFSFRQMYYDNRLYFGQTVLSITGNPSEFIDSYHKSRSGRFDILLNGEIYNHEELFEACLKPAGFISRSFSDTEALVNLHDVKSPIDIFNELNGMFAYVSYDSLENILIIGRDIIGEKILYRYEDDDLMILSSEIGPIIEMKPSVKINTNVLREYFFTRHLLAPDETTFEGVNLVQPGNLIKFDLRSASFETLCVRRPADLIDPGIIENNKRRSADDLVDEMEAVFENTARLVTPPIDYYSVFSGGIDSSLASVFVSKRHSPKGLIALQFPGKDKVSEDLLVFEKKLGRSIDRLVVNEELFGSFYGDCYKAACGPLSTHSFVSQAIMSRYVKEQATKVLIGGDGADELFGGYEFYKRFCNIKTFPENNPSPYSGFVPLAVRFFNWTPGKIQEEIRERWKTFSSYYEFEDDPIERMIQTALYSDTVVQLESVGIRAADTMSMVNSVESRCFYLSQGILKFALNLPACHKVDLCAADELFVTKPLLKRLFIRHLGKNLLFPKQGFSGFPNESGRILIDNNYDLVKKVLELAHIPEINGRISQTIEWKLINVELFLDKFCSHQ